MLPQLQIWASLFVGEAVRSLLRHKLRSTLTTLGIVIGIAAVILVVAIGKAGSERVEAQLQALGDNLVWVEAGSRNVAGARTGNHGTTSLTLDDAAAIGREVRRIKSVSPQIDSSGQIVYGNRNWSTRFRGVAPAYLPIKRWEIAAGAAFTDEDVEQAANVCLIGQTVRDQLFGARDPIGELLRVGTQFFAVVGVLSPKGQSASGFDQDDAVFLPYTTMQKKLRGKGLEWVDDIVCSAASAQDVTAARGEVIGLMRQRHLIGPDDEDDFNIRRPDEMIKAQVEASRTFALLLIAIASISLLIGGIGIMNVMLATVAERTREIGLRLAVGAKEWIVQMQFLGEAIVLSLFGGVLGVLLSILACFGVERILDWHVSIPPQAIGLAVVFSVTVGVFFGFYPARRAARLDPIVALRHE